jgi:hypothetical protein
LGGIGGFITINVPIAHVAFGECELVGIDGGGGDVAFVTESVTNQILTARR